MTQKSNDEGVDGLINEDRLGLDRIYVQASAGKSQWAVLNFRISLGHSQGQQAHKGIFITTGEFGATADEFVKKLHSVLF